jgi:hypothetical protein
VVATQLPFSNLRRSSRNSVVFCLELKVSSPISAGERWSKVGTVLPAFVFPSLRIFAISRGEEWRRYSTCADCRQFHQYVCRVFERRTHMKSISRWLCGCAVVCLLVLVVIASASAQIPTNGTSPSAAAPTYDIDQPGRVPYQAHLRGSGGGTSEIDFSFKPVPAGHRVVIQQVTGTLGLTGIPSSDTKLSVYLSNNFAPGDASFTFLTAAFTGFVPSGWFSQAVQYYVDAGDQPQLRLFTPVFGFSFGDLTLIGYEVDCTAAPCQAIAGDSAKGRRPAAVPKLP